MALPDDEALPEGVAADSDRLTQFHNELCVARRVTLALALVLAAFIGLSSPLSGAGDALQPAAAKAPALPSEIPLFPLPEASLFPGASRAFVIFEPRYREMIADALKGDRIIGMIQLREGFEKDYEGRPPIFAIGCAGTIDKYEQLPDGRYLILLRGLARFRVTSEDQRKPYRLARIEVLPELLKDVDRASLRMARTRIEALLARLLPPDVERPDPSMGDAEFVNTIAQNLDMPETTRQDLLERNDVIDRARALTALLEEEVGSRRRVKELRAPERFARGRLT